ARYNRPEHPVIDHRTWVFLGDGCLMEGISHEVASLAGTLRLGKLIAFWDDNGISIDGEVKGWFTDDTVQRFQAYGWQVIPAVDGHDPEAIKSAVVAALDDEERPTLICCRTTIGYGAPTKAGKEVSHGAPLGAEEIAGARKLLGWAHAPFEIPAEIKSGWDARLAGGMRSKEWQRHFDAYAKVYPAEAAELSRRMRGELPVDFADAARAYIESVQAKLPEVASRKAS